MIRIIAIDDHPIITESLVRWAEALEHLEVLATGSALDALPELLEAHTPDVVVLDYMMPGVRGAASLRPHLLDGLRALVFSLLDDPAAIHELRRVGVRGFVPKTASIAELVEAIEAVHAGRVRKKLGVESTPELISYAYAHGLRSAGAPEPE